MKAVKQGVYFLGECSEFRCRWHSHHFRDGNAANSAAEMHEQKFEYGHVTRIWLVEYVNGRLERKVLS